MPPEDEPEPVSLPITGELDLHTFQLGEIPVLLNEYFAACLEHGIRRVRVIHGKGTGTLRELVHGQLRKSPAVAGFASGDENTGSWGATLVNLKPLDSSNSDRPS